MTSFMLIKVFCVLSMLSKLPPVVCLRGGGGATGSLNKGGGEQQASKFHRYRLVLNNALDLALPGYNNSNKTMSWYSSDG